jgi:putative endonuclease
LEQRLIAHNQLAKKGFTARYRPWEIVHLEEFKTKTEAMKREKQLKSSRGRHFIWEQIIKN